MSFESETERVVSPYVYGQQMFVDNQRDEDQQFYFGKPAKYFEHKYDRESENIKLIRDMIYFGDPMSQTTLEPATTTENDFSQPTTSPLPIDNYTRSDSWGRGLLRLLLVVVSIAASIMVSMTLIYLLIRNYYLTKSRLYREGNVS